jgi:hypothetical protein
MNGRIYDPILRQFMSPDNYVQDPYNTQNFNRFGYVLNNPLLYTDPSGEILVPILIGIGVAMLTTAIANISAGIPFWHGMGKAAVVGAISGAISFGIGEAVTGITSFWAKAGLQAGLHGMKSGMMSAIEGGNFLSGFAAGAISSLVSSGVEALGNSGAHFCVDDAGNDVVSSTLGSRNVGALKAVMIASGGLSGGISSSIAGGSFWKGVREGLITSGLNALATSVIEESAKTDPTKIKKSNSSDVKEGDVLNYHSDGSGLDLFAQQSKPKKGVVELHDHGYAEGTDHYSIETILKLGEELYQKSPTWRSMVDNGIDIELHLYSCTTGANTDSGGSGFAQTLSKFYPRVTVKAPTDYWTVRSYKNLSTGQVRLSHGFIKSPGVWKLFKNGKEIN